MLHIFEYLNKVKYNVNSCYVEIEQIKKGI